MGKIASATTVYAEAYLTELGRKYLFEMAGHASNASQLASESKR